RGNGSSSEVRVIRRRFRIMRGEGMAAHRTEPAPAAAAGPAAEESPVFASRRLILKATLTLPALSVLGCTRRRSESTPPHPDPLAYFKPGERDFIDAATQRLIPDGD